MTTIQKNSRAGVVANQWLGRKPLAAADDRRTTGRRPPDDLRTTAPALERNA